jgi:cyclopropane-fatty-acyl-phospholipid synthase
MPSTRSNEQKRSGGRGYARSRPQGRGPSAGPGAPPTGARKGSPAPASDPALRHSRRLLEQVFGPLSARRFSVRFWDGTLDAPPVEPGFTLVLNHPGALRRMLLPPTQATMGAAYARGHVDLEGDIEGAAAVAYEVAARLRSPLLLLAVMVGAARLPRDRSAGSVGPFSSGGPRGSKHSRRRDAAAVTGHYDVGNDFYRLFLDRRMVYSCAYFADGSDDLDRAQEAKLDHICRKLRLRPGECFLDIGCGWGALVLHAAERYGVEALGITLSEPQARLARERIAAADLGERCRVEVRDYRDLPPDAGFDKVASIGMVEHVGRRRIRTYFEEVARHLAPGGLFLNHGIVSLDGPPGPLGRLGVPALRPSASFIQRYVFPDSELLSVTELTAPGERVGLELRDTESLREHYARTLRHWVRRLESNQEEARRLVGDDTYRVWRLYMGGCAHTFTAGAIGIVQMLWGKPAEGGLLPLPATRADLYVS